MSRKERMPYQSTDCSCDSKDNKWECSECKKIVCEDCDPDELDNIYQCYTCELDICIDCCFGCNFCDNMYCLSCDQKSESCDEMCKKCEEQASDYSWN